MQINPLTDTIAAIATATGVGGVGIVRISGDNAINCLRQLYTPYNKKDLEPRKLTLGQIMNSEGINIDQVLAVYFPAPHSYTTEDVVEIHCHGGALVQKSILKAVLKSGARLANPGEFTMRAFINGRIDLSQAEAVIDIIEAKTEKALSLAENQLRGDLSEKISEIEEIILALLAEISAAADFPDDIELLQREQIINRINETNRKIEHLLKGASEGRIYKDGISIVLVGAVNVGKSSILNKLLGEDRAIVTSLPGTTRDIIEEYLNIEGIPVLISDTAGLREAGDEAEEIGISKSKGKIKAARIVLIVIDAEKGLDEEAERIIKENIERPLIIVVNKNDLVSEKNTIKQIKKITPEKEIVSISAKTGKGIIDLKMAISKLVLGNEINQVNKLYITNLRHQEALFRSNEYLQSARETLENDLPEDLAGIDIMLAWQALGEISGKTAGDDILDKIFSSFCLGK